MRSLISIKEGFVFYSECVKGLGGQKHPTLRVRLIVPKSSSLYSEAMTLPIVGKARREEAFTLKGNES